MRRREVNGWTSHAYKRDEVATLIKTPQKGKNCNLPSTRPLLPRPQLPRQPVFRPVHHTLRQHAPQPRMVQQASGTQSHEHPHIWQGLRFVSPLPLFACQSAWFAAGLLTSQRRLSTCVCVCVQVEGTRGGDTVQFRRCDTVPFTQPLIRVGLTVEDEGAWSVWDLL